MMQQARPVTTVARGGKLPRAVLVVAAVVALALLTRLVFFQQNSYEKMADRVTKAIVANDMRPVVGEFNALRRPQLLDRAKVGQLSDFVNGRGAFKRTQEDTPKDAGAGVHHFLAHFEKGDLSEDMTLDADGKIANFHVRPLDAR